MNTPAKLALLLLLSVLPWSMIAQSVHRQASPLGLTRLRGSDGAAKVASSPFEVDKLTVGSTRGARRERRGALDVVKMDAEVSFSRPLRSRSKSVGYVSVQAYGSLGTVINLGGAMIGVSESAMVDNYAEVVVRGGSGDWQSTGINVRFDTFDGNRLATMPVLTIRLNPDDGVFDVYSDSRLAVSDVAYVPETNRRNFTLTAGSDGAWLMGLVQSDENPLYLDENDNGIDDDFEHSRRGKLMKATASRSERKSLIKEWRKFERAVPPPALFVARPRPD